MTLEVGSGNAEVGKKAEFGSGKSEVGVRESEKGSGTSEKGQIFDCGIRIAD